MRKTHLGLYRRAFALALLLALLLPAVVGAFPPGIVIDGANNAEGYLLASQQNTPTAFGDSNMGLTTWANGSELDAAWVSSDSSYLYLLLTGNLETNYNKLDIFIDSTPGGQNRLLGNNADVDFNGLNRMGDDGSGNGLTFDAGFEADFFLTITNGDAGGGVYQKCASFATMPTLGGGVGTFLGCAQGDGNNIVGPNGIEIGSNNSNTGGVSGSAVNDPTLVTTGFEIKVPFAAIGGALRVPLAESQIVAFVNGSGHDFLSNQLLGGLGGGSNLGEPRTINLGGIAGDQYFLAPSPLAVSLSGAITDGSSSLLMVAAATAGLLTLSIVVLRRRRAG